MKSLEMIPKSQHHLKTLLAEDNETTIQIILALMETLGHTLIVVENGKEALRYLAAEPFDLVLMDVEMPEMDGLSATRELRAGRAGKINQNTPVLALTAHDLDDFRARCFTAGMNDCLTKPIHIENLKTALSGCGDGGPIQNKKRLGSLSENDETLLNKAAALDNLEGDKNLLAGLFAIFTKNGPMRIREIHEGILTRNPKMTLDAAHTLKGNAATIGADIFVKSITCIYEQVQARKWKEATEQMKQIEYEYQRVFVQIQKEF